MANILYMGLGDTSQAFGKYDLDTATQTRLADSPLVFAGNAQLSYDGYYAYHVGADPATGVKKLARYNPGTDTWALKAGGAAVPNDGGNVACVSNGATVFIYSQGNLYGYNISLDSLALLTVFGTGTNNPLICWDYADTLYLCPNNWNNGFKKYTISTNTFTSRSFAFTTYRNNFASDSLLFTNAKLYFGGCCFDDGNYYFGVMTDSGTQFVMDSSDATHFIGTTNQQNGATLVSPSVLARSSGSTLQVCDLTSYHAAGTALSHTFGGAHGGTVFTLSLNTTFTFYEKDGITAAPLTDHLGGGKAVGSGAFAGPFAYQIAAASPRTTVTVSVIPVTNQPMSLTAALATAVGGPFSVDGLPVQTLQIGPMTAGQKKTIYLGNFVPTGATPGTYSFSIQVTSS